MAVGFREILILATIMGAGYAATVPELYLEGETLQRAVRYSSQIKRTPHEDKVLGKEDNSQGNHIISSSFENEADASELGVLLYEVPLSPFETKYKSNLGKFLNSLTAHQLKDYDQRRKLNSYFAANFENVFFEGATSQVQQAGGVEVDVSKKNKPAQAKVSSQNGNGKFQEDQGQDVHQQVQVEPLRPAVAQSLISRGMTSTSDSKNTFDKKPNEIKSYQSIFNLLSVHLSNIGISQKWPQYVASQNPYKFTIIFSQLSNSKPQFFSSLAPQNAISMGKSSVAQQAITNNMVSQQPQISNKATTTLPQSMPQVRPSISPQNAFKGTVNTLAPISAGLTPFFTNTFRSAFTNVVVQVLNNPPLYYVAISTPLLNGGIADIQDALDVLNIMGDVFDAFSPKANRVKRPAQNLPADKLFEFGEMADDIFQYEISLPGRVQNQTSISAPQIQLGLTAQNREPMTIADIQEILDDLNKMGDVFDAFTTVPSDLDRIENDIFQYETARPQVPSQGQPIEEIFEETSEGVKTEPLTVNDESSLGSLNDDRLEFEDQYLDGQLSFSDEDKLSNDLKIGVFDVFSEPEGNLFSLFNVSSANPAAEEEEEVQAGEKPVSPLLTKLYQESQVRLDAYISYVEKFETLPNFIQMVGAFNTEKAEKFKGVLKAQIDNVSQEIYKTANVIQEVNDAQLQLESLKEDAVGILNNIKKKISKEMGNIRSIILDINQELEYYYDYKADTKKRLEAQKKKTREALNLKEQELVDLNQNLGELTDEFQEAQWYLMNHLNRLNNRIIAADMNPFSPTRFLEDLFSDEVDTIEEVWSVLSNSMGDFLKDADEDDLLLVKECFEVIWDQKNVIQQLISTIQDLKNEVDLADKSKNDLEAEFDKLFVKVCSDTDFLKEVYDLEEELIKLRQSSEMFERLVTSINIASGSQDINAPFKELNYFLQNPAIYSDVTKKSVEFMRDNSYAKTILEDFSKTSQLLKSHDLESLEQKKAELRNQKKGLDLELREFNENIAPFLLYLSLNEARDEEENFTSALKKMLEKKVQFGPISHKQSMQKAEKLQSDYKQMQLDEDFDVEMWMEENAPHLKRALTSHTKAQDLHL